MPGFLRWLFGCDRARIEIERGAQELHEARGDLRRSVSGLGQDVWTLVETGDPLRALVHGVHNARFRQEISEGGE